MKRNLLSISKKYFSKTVSIPPKLRNASIDSRKNQGLYKYEALIDNPRDNNLNEEKAHYNNLIESCSKSMIFNHFKLNDIQSNHNFNEFYNYITKNLHTNELNKFIQILDEIKTKLDSNNIEKTEDIFKYLLSKLYYLSNDKGKQTFYYCLYN